MLRFPVLVLAVLALAAPAEGALPRLSVERESNPAVVDAGGREVLLRGVNVNQLGDYYAFDPARPTVIPLTRSDVSQIADLGFNVIRLVMSWSALEPQRATFGEAYIARVREVVGWARDEGVYVVLDMHQDAWGKYIATPPDHRCEPGFGPSVGWDGAPEWATFTDGHTTCRAQDTRELSPAVAQAFTNFYNDRFGIQERLVQTWARVAREFAGNPTVAGYDLINEPHPGYLVGPQQSFSLGAFYRRAIDAIRASESAAGGFPHIVFFEPSVVWSGVGTDAIPPPDFTTDRHIVFAPHLYAESITIDRKANQTGTSIEQGWHNARGAARQYDAPLWSGEWGWFGAPEDNLDEVHRYLRQEDFTIVGGAWWVWKQACGDPHVAGAPSFSGSLHPVSCPGDVPLGRVEPYLTALTRPYPRFAPNRLKSLEANPRTHEFVLTGTTGGRRDSCRLEVWVPGAGAPQVQATNVRDLGERRLGSGWLVSGCASGEYEMRGRPGNAPAPATTPGVAGPALPECRSRRVVTIRLPRGLRRVRVRVTGARARAIERLGRVVRIDFRGARRAVATVAISARRADGRRYTARRTVRTCGARLP